MSTVWLLRHGASTAAHRACTGWSDPELADPEGTTRRMRAFADVIGEAELILTSDLRRASGTALPVARALRAPMRRLRSLREISFGLWEGLTWEQIAARHPAAHADYIGAWRSAAFPDGESVPALWRRVERVAHRLPAGRTVVIAHAGSLRALAAAILGWTMEQAMARSIRCGHAALIQDGACLAWDVDPERTQPAWRKNS